MSYDKPKYDLHCHSTNSDGMNTPLELGLHAAKKGLDFLVITDHNRLTDFPNMVGEVVLGKGIEISTYDYGIPSHILCYANAFSSGIIDLIYDIRQLQMLEQTSYFDSDFSKEDIVKLYPSVEEVSKYTRNGTNTILSIAHPNCTYKEILCTGNFEAVENHIIKLICMGINGIEINVKANKERTKFILGIAKKYNLFITAGSDSHAIGYAGDIGTLGPYIDAELRKKIYEDFRRKIEI